MPSNEYYHYRQPPRPTPSPKKRRRWPGLVLAVVILVGGYYGFRLFGSDLHLPGHKPQDAKVAAAPKPTLSSGQLTAMSAQINSVINQYPDMDIGVSIEDLNNDARYHYGISNPFIAASESKILTATLFLHQVEQGQQNLSENVDGNTAQYELQQLIEISDMARAYSRKAPVEMPSLSEYERQQKAITRNPEPAAKAVAA